LTLPAAPPYSRSNRLQQKYTLQPQGLWARINRLFAVDAGRSTGVPLNSQFRNPTPGGLDPKEYDDPVTVPAGDIADNPYWKRDTRRRYPQLSVVNQADVVGLLSVGSKANPKEEVLQIGDAGQQQLVALKEEGQKGLKAFFEKDKSNAAAVLDANGLPPMPTPMSAPVTPAVKRYEMTEEQSYAGK
jgi:hypothetical protein